MSDALTTRLPAPHVEPDEVSGEGTSLSQRIREGTLRPESYPGDWHDRRRAARRRHIRRGLAGWALALMIVSVSACTASVAITAGGLVGYTGYSIYRLVESGRSWSAAAYDFLFTAKPQPAPANPPPADRRPDCSWGDWLKGKC